MAFRCWTISSPRGTFCAGKYTDLADFLRIFPFQVNLQRLPHFS